MCNDYEQHVRWAEYCQIMQDLELGIPTRQTELDLPEADDIRINDVGPGMRASGNVVELVPMNFRFAPTGRGGPVFNFRSEGRRFDTATRCIVPASAFFEFTGLHDIRSDRQKPSLPRTRRHVRGDTWVPFAVR